MQVRNREQREGRNRGRYRQRRNVKIYYYYAVIAALLAIWFSTPVSDWITDMIVDSIPLQEDVALGDAAVNSQRYRF